MMDRRPEATEFHIVTALGETERNDDNNTISRRSADDSYEPKIDSAGETKSKEKKKNQILSRKINAKRKSRLHPNTKDEQVMALKKDRYSKLFHQAQKQLTKQVKQVRTFLVQRQIRKLKSSRSGGEASNDQQQEQHQNAFHPLKDLSLDLVVQQAMRQLGLIHANPCPDHNVIALAPPLDRSSPISQLVFKILDHKRFQDALEEWNEKVAEFRRFCLQLDDKDDPFLAAIGSIQKKKKKGQANKGRTTTSLLAPPFHQQQQPISFFCSSLNDDVTQPTENSDDLMMAYGPAASLDHSNNDMVPIKKNRRGQRARKAKALAIQAKRDGKKQGYYQSLNWREEKSSKQQQQPQKIVEKKEMSKQLIDVKKAAVAAPAPLEDQSSNHPSWTAKQQQKPKIVPFQGKKITFD
jgi:hypothetical protein